MRWLLVKGTASQEFEIVFNAASKTITCRPPDLSRGTFLMFLKKEGDAYALSSPWYSRASVEKDAVLWLIDAPTDLPTLIAEIRRIGKTE